MDKTFNTILLIGLGIVIGMELQKRKIGETYFPQSDTPIFLPGTKKSLSGAIKSRSGKTLLHANA